MTISRRGLGAALAAPFVRAAGSVRAGAATANISPVLGTSLAGFMTDRKTADVHDELLVRCAALESGSRRLLLCTIDSCMVPRGVLDRCRARIAAGNSVEPACILLSSTHTHSAPPAMHLFQSLPDEKYIAILEERICDAASMAFRRLRPARVGIGLGNEPSLIFNRRYFMKEGSIPADPFGGTRDKVQMNPPAQSPNLLRPAGPVDADHPLIAALGEDGRMIWVYASYAFHYAGFNPADHASADYFGSWCRLVEHSLAGEGVALLANGCAANINGLNLARPFPPGRDYTVIDRTASVLAFESLRVLRSLTYTSDVTLAGALENVELATRRPSKSETAEAIKLVGENPGNAFKERPLIYARETVFVSRFPASVSVPVQGLRIGDHGIGTFPGETFVELGLDIKAKRLLKTTSVISIANDACGYIPTVDAFDAGGYETWRAKSSFVEREAAPKLIAGIERVLAKTTSTQ
ncbi:MAG: hypothetical protein FJW30_17610 [Acidobacteria bacterium]|nr:hypothetical protein [Acidobacteriota bacterium]